MTKPEFRVVEGGAMDKMKALEHALTQIEKMHGKGSVMRLGANDQSMDIEAISTGSGSQSSFACAFSRCSQPCAVAPEGALSPLAVITGSASHGPAKVRSRSASPCPARFPSPVNRS